MTTQTRTWISSALLVCAFLLPGLSHASTPVLATDKDECGDGNDYLDGGPGTDTAVYSGKRAEYHVTKSAEKQFVIRDLVTCRNETDTVLNVEKFKFSDGTKTLKKLKPDTDLSSKKQKATVADLKTLAEFPDAGITWKNKFALGTIPTGSFRATYFNTTKPTSLTKQETVASIDVNFPWYYDTATGSDTAYSSATTIRSEDFGGYWIGKFVNEKDTEMTLNVTQSWSETRVIIDGKLAYRGGDNTSLKFMVPKGSHTMEVEYVNNWHTTGFSVSLAAAGGSTKPLTGTLKLGSHVKDVWYAGVYESSAFDKTIALKAGSYTQTPKALFLSSYDTVKWDLSALSSFPIETIVISSYSPGSRVVNGPAAAQVHTASLGYAYQAKAQCYAITTFMSCEGVRDFSNMYHKIKSVSGKELTGFSGTYSASSLTLPGTVLTSALVKEYLAYPAEIDAKIRAAKKAETLDATF
ncbi:MAG: hypothetical protein V4682_02770 [Patescibacteria group bacterium]